MNTINTIGSQPAFVPAEGTGATHTAATATTGAVTGTAVQDTPSTAPGSVPGSAQPSTAAPTLPPPALKVDYSGAKNTMSAYTALIILVCETNRESYAANRAMSKAQMHTRVAELKDVAAKRKTAAIVGLVMSVISGAVGVAGGIHGIVGSSKNLHTLHELKGGAKPDVQKANQNKVGLDGSGGADEELLPDVLGDDDGLPAAQAPAQGAHADEAENANPGDGPDANAGVGNADAEKNADRDMTLRGVEVESARLQSLAVLYGSIQNSTNSLGQSASGIVSSEADLMAADAETTEAARQTTVSSMQQFQDLMSKFTQILSALLEAENKARSAAAQA